METATSAVQLGFNSTWSIRPIRRTSTAVRSRHCTLASRSTGRHDSSELLIATNVSREPLLTPWKDTLFRVDAETGRVSADHRAARWLQNRRTLQHPMARECSSPDARRSGNMGSPKYSPLFLPTRWLGSQGPHRTHRLLPLRPQSSQIPPKPPSESTTNSPPTDNTCCWDSAGTEPPL